MLTWWSTQRPSAYERRSDGERGSERMALSIDSRPQAIETEPYLAWWLYPTHYLDHLLTNDQWSR